MKIHEYQAKAILKKYGVPVPRGEMAETVQQVEAAAKSLFAAGSTGVGGSAHIPAGVRGGNSPGRSRQGGSEEDCEVGCRSTGVGRQNSWDDAGDPSDRS